MIKKLNRAIFYYIIPSETNNYHPRSLQISAISLYIVFLIAVQWSTKLIIQFNPQILGYATNITVEKIYYLVNQERLKDDIPLLRYSQELSRAAYDKAIDMFNKDYWAHVSPTGVTPWEFITDTGYEYIYAGENLAKDFDQSESVVEAWMNSSTHRANILKTEYTDIGIAVVNGKLQGKETTLIVQEFGKRIGEDVSVITSASSDRTDNLRNISGRDKKIVQKVNKNKNLISKISILNGFNSPFSRITSLILLEFLLVVLFIDTVFIWRKNVIRLTGKSLAHLFFMASLIAAIGFAGVGVIL